MARGILRKVELDVGYDHIDINCSDNNNNIDTESVNMCDLGTSSDALIDDNDNNTIKFISQEAK